LEIRGVSAVGILGARIYLRDAESLAPRKPRLDALSRGDKVDDAPSTRHVVDVIDLRTSAARQATKEQRQLDTQHHVLRPDPGDGRGVFLDITV
jgi:hypothetical protein